MCECNNTLWTFILTPTGILPNTQKKSSKVTLAPNKGHFVNIWLHWRPIRDILLTFGYIGAQYGTFC